MSFRPSYERKLDVKDYDTDGDISSLYVSMYKRDYYIHQVGVQDPRVYGLLIADQSQVGYLTTELVTEYFGTERLIKITSRVVLIETHWAVAELCWAVRSVNS